MNNTKQILVTHSSLPPIDEYSKEISSLWESHWLTNMGEKHQQLQADLAKYLGVKDITLYVNGHQALECILEAMELGKDDRKKVITTPFTFVSTTHAIVRKGLQPVFADISKDNYTLDPKSIEKLIDDETCAIMPVHVYGNICDCEAIEALASKHNLKVIYDAAHAFGVKKNGKSVASFGDASMFSFHATKVFNTIEGGAIAFKDDDLMDKLNQWKNFGITGPETCEYIGGNAKMNEFCAAMGICNLRHLGEEIAKRKVVAERYWSNLEDCPGLKFCKPPSDIEYNYAYMPVIFEDEFGKTRDEVFDSLAQNGIIPRKYFYPLTSDYACYNELYDSSETPVAKDIANRVLTLPMYADLSLEAVDKICSTVQGCFNEQ